MQVAGSDAFNPWPDNAPTSPDTPGAGNGDSLFGMPVCGSLFFKKICCGAGVKVKF